MDNPEVKAIPAFKLLYEHEFKKIGEMKF